MHTAATPTTAGPPAAAPAPSAGTVTRAAADPTRRPGWQLRSQHQLLMDQIDALDAWRRTRDPQARPAVGTAGLSREQHLDAERRTAALQRERSAVLAALDRQLLGTGRLTAPSAARVLVAHRGAWFRDRLTTSLAEHGVLAAASLEDGADAIGAAVVEQPDVLLVEDRLPSVTGLDVVAAVHQLAPRALLAVQVLSTGEGQRFLDAGAHAVFSRSVSPAQVGLALARRLFEPGRADGEPRTPAQRTPGR